MDYSFSQWEHTEEYIVFIPRRGGSGKLVIFREHVYDKIREKREKRVFSLVSLSQQQQT